MEGNEEAGPKNTEELRDPWELDETSWTTPPLVGIAKDEHDLNMRQIKKNDPLTPNPPNNTLTIPPFGFFSKKEGVV